MASTNVVVVTDSAEGMRVRWPSGSSRTFAAPSYLADAYARTVMGAADARELIVTDVMERLRALGEQIESGSGSRGGCLEQLDQIERIRERLAAAVSSLIVD